MRCTFSIYNIIYLNNNSKCFIMCWSIFINYFISKTFSISLN